MHGLEVPLALAGGGSQADQRFSEQVLAGAVSTVEIVAGRADGQVEQAALGVERHGRPDVGMASELFRAVAPGLDAVLAGARDGVEGPGQLAGARVEGAHVAGRVLLENHAVGDAVADDDEVLVDHGWRGVGVLFGVGLPAQTSHQIDDSVVAKAGHGFASLGIERDQVGAAVHDNAELPRLRIAPRSDAAMDEAGAVGDLAVDVGFRVVGPFLMAGGGVEGDHAVVRRADVHDSVDHQRSGFEHSGSGFVLRERDLAGFPFPCGLQVRDVGFVDEGERGVVGLPGVLCAGGKSEGGDEGADSVVHAGLRKFCATRSAVRRVRATKVRVPLVQPALGRVGEPATKRFSWSWV